MARIRNSHVLLVIALLFACLAAGQEIKRPTADMDGGKNTNLGCVGQDQASTAMPTLSAEQDLTKLQVAICTEGDSGGGDVNFIGSDKRAAL